MQECQFLPVDELTDVFQTLFFFCWNIPITWNTPRCLDPSLHKHHTLVFPASPPSVPDLARRPRNYLRDLCFLFFSIAFNSFSLRSPLAREAGSGGRGGGELTSPVAGVWRDPLSLADLLLDRPSATLGIRVQGETLWWCCQLCSLQAESWQKVHVSEWRGHFLQHSWDGCHFSLIMFFSGCLYRAKRPAGDWEDFFFFCHL